MIEKTISDMAKGAPLMPDDYHPAMAWRGMKIMAHPKKHPRYLLQQIVEPLTDAQRIAAGGQAHHVETQILSDAKLRMRKAAWAIQCALEAGRQAELDAAFGPEMVDAPVHDWSDSDFFVRA
jgi:hypothetical protein